MFTNIVKKFSDLIKKVVHLNQQLKFTLNWWKYISLYIFKILLFGFVHMEAVLDDKILRVKEKFSKITTF